MDAHSVCALCGLYSKWQSWGQRRRMPVDRITMPHFHCYRTLPSLCRCPVPLNCTLMSREREQPPTGNKVNEWLNEERKATVCLTLAKTSIYIDKKHSGEEKVKVYKLSPPELPRELRAQRQMGALAVVLKTKRKKCLSDKHDDARTNETN